MGFSGGGSNVLLPHTHDGRISQDGGALQFNNVTQSQSAQGEIFYSDGVALQQLAYPGVPAGETLTASPLSVAPSWVAGAAAATVWTQLADVTIGAPGQLSSGVFAAHDMLDIWIMGGNTVGQNTALTFNNSSSTAYKNNTVNNGVYASNTGNTEVTIYGANTQHISYIHLYTFYDNATTETAYNWQAMNFQSGAGNVPWDASGWGYFYGGQITQVDKSQYGAVAIDQSAGARIVVNGSIP